MLQADLSKRYGNLKNGVNDIKSHRFFTGINWSKLLAKEIKGPYIPEVKYDPFMFLLFVGVLETPVVSLNIQTQTLRVLPSNSLMIPS